MTKKIQLIPCGIPLVDLAWRGLYSGGTYLLIGPRKSGKTLLALQYALECVKSREVCLFFTSIRAKDLLIHAASIDFDLQHYMNQNQVIVVKVTPPPSKQNADESDENLAEYLRDISTVVDQYKPDKIVFDELTTFISFNDRKLLKETFLQTIETIEDKGITSLFTLAEPANPASRNIIDTLVDCSTGVIDLQKNADVLDGDNPGTMTITPNVGHTEGKFASNYFIVPNKGISVDYKTSEAYQSDEDIIPKETKRKYESFAEIKIPAESISFSNIYSLNEFELIINNQIAMYQITGQMFSLVSVRLDEQVLEKQLITLAQLRNAVRISVDKKDKICTIGTKILVLIPGGTGEATKELVAKIKSNLPYDEENYIRSVSRFISIYAVTVSEKVSNANYMIKKILEDTEMNNAGPSVF